MAVGSSLEVFEVIHDFQMRQGTEARTRPASDIAEEPFMPPDSTGEWTPFPAEIPAKPIHRISLGCGYLNGVGPNQMSA